jgi:uncharacterized membrane protein
MVAIGVPYNWWKFLHVAGVLSFVLFHGVSIIAALRLWRERDRTRIGELLRFSGSSVLGMYLSLAWLVVFGVIAGVSGGYWDDGWFWISIAILVLVVAEMSAVGKPYYQRVKEAIELRPSGVPRKSDEELEEILRSRVGVVNAVIGFVALLAIAWLMIFKPFTVL